MSLSNGSLRSDQSEIWRSLLQHQEQMQLPRSHQIRNNSSSDFRRQLSTSYVLCTLGIRGVVGR